MSLSEKDKRILKALAPIAEIELCRKEYAFYVEYAHRPTGSKKSQWARAKHLEFICNSIQSFIETNTGHAFDILILQCPPQHGKSMTVTETLPSWYLGKYPENRVILASYNDDTAERFCRRNKSKIKDVGTKVWGIKIGDVDRATDFEIAGHQGAMISRGIMSGITSNPANLIIIDDPVKNRQEADSDTYRDRQWEEWLNTIKTRLAASAKIIVIMTRWHEDDLAGRIIQNEKNVTIINLPCEAEENDPLGRAVGDSLFPEIGKDNKWLGEFKQGYQTQEGNRAWLALFQGKPSAVEGNMIKREWWKYYTELPRKFDRLLQSWDMTFKDTDGSDYVVGQVWGSYGADIYLIDQTRARMDFPSTVQAFLDMTKKHPTATTKLVEDKANGSAVIAMLRHKVGGIIAITPKESKQARVSAVSPLIEAGNVHLPMNAPFTNAFVEECSSFPNGAHDDQVDCMSQALTRFMYVREHDLTVEIPDNLPEDLKQDLINEPEALRMWLAEHGRI
ncbi:MAG: phage terminase large subunit [Bacillota bacterium]|nr:phage terminase large subunit [Bacillota bacterium]